MPIQIPWLFNCAAANNPQPHASNNVSQYNHNEEFPSVFPTGVESDIKVVGLIFKLFFWLPLKTATVYSTHSADTPPLRTANTEVLKIQTGDATGGI